MGSYLFFLLILACPLMMMFMMRGGHGHGGHAHNAGVSGPSSLEELRRRRDELDAQIAAHDDRKEFDDRAHHAEHA